MPIVGVWENKRGGLFRALETALGRHAAAGGIKLSRISPESAQNGGTYDLLVWQEGAPATPQPHTLRARILVVAGEDAPSALGRCSADTVVTVGHDPRNTITLSSALSHERGMASLQREVVALDGQVVPPQELLLDGLSGTVNDRLSAQAALLACGLLGE